MEVVEYEALKVGDYYKFFKLLDPYSCESRLLAGQTFDVDIAFDSLQRFAENDSYGLFVINGINKFGDDEFIGCMIASVDRTWWSSQKMAEDILLFVKEEHRGSLAAVKLIQAYKDWALAKEADVIRLSSMSGIKPERTAKLYQRLGFDLVGMVNLLEVD